MFPSFESWRKIIAEGDEKFIAPKFYDYYKTKYEICSRFEPKSILEIGVRYGYSAYSFLCACPEALYLGIDLLAGGHGGVKVDTFGYVKKILKAFSKADVTLSYYDTRLLKCLWGNYDFIHIDGDHTERASYHDMQICFEVLTPGGTMLIDDVHYIEGVYRAAVRFEHDNKEKIEFTEVIPSLRGEFLIRKKKR